MTPHTDDLLGAALRELEVPEHRPEFHRELRRRLRAERRPVHLRVAAGGGALAAAVAVAVILVSLRGGGSASAATVQAHVRSALASLRTLSGTLIASGPGQGPTKRWEFILDRRGDLRLEGPERGDVETYDAVQLTMRSAQHSASLGGPTLFYAEQRGLAQAPMWVLPEQFAGYVRTALAAGDPALRNVIYEGRPAWRLLIANHSIELTVDRATWMPVEVNDLRHKRLIRIAHLTVNRPVPASAFTFTFPQGAEVSRADFNFRRARLADAPLAPGWVPAGYRLAQAARSGNVWSLSYRRGFDQLVVNIVPGTTGKTLPNTPIQVVIRRKGVTATVSGDATHAELERVTRSLH